MPLPLYVHFSGLFLVIFKTAPASGANVADDAGEDPANLLCKEVGEAKIFLLDAGKAYENHMTGHHAIDAHLPRLTVDLRYANTTAVPDEIVLASEPDAKQPYKKGIVEVGVWNLQGPCYLRSDGATKPLKIVWGNRDGTEFPDDSPGNHSSDLGWAADLEKCEGVGKLGAGFWNTSDYETRCAARIRLSSGRLRAFTPDRTIYEFKNPVNNQTPTTPYKQAFATALILKMEPATTHVIELADGSEIELTEPSSGTWTEKVAQVSNYPNQPPEDDKDGQKHFAAYYDLTAVGMKDLDNVERFIPYRDRNAVGVYRPKCILGQGYET